MQISGEIVVSAQCAPFEKATVYIYLEDVARADAAARVLGTGKLLSGTHRTGAESRIPFAVEFPGAADPATTSVRVHVSRDGGEEIAASDLVSTAHHPAVEGEILEIAVREV